MPGILKSTRSMSGRSRPLSGIKRRFMDRLPAYVLGVCVVVIGAATIAAAPQSEKAGSPIYGVTLPDGYRDWRLVSVAHEAGKNNDIRAILGNDVAIKAFREGTRPFPDGTIIARVAWQYESSARNDALFPAPQSFIAGQPTNVQIIVKNAKRYRASGGWGYGQFENGKPNMDAGLIRQCFACHAKLQSTSDFVFTTYAR